MRVDMYAQTAVPALQYLSGRRQNERPSFLHSFLPSFMPASYLFLMFSAKNSSFEQHVPFAFVLLLRFLSIAQLASRPHLDFLPPAPPAAASWGRKRARRDIFSAWRKSVSQSASPCRGSNYTRGEGQRKICRSLAVGPSSTSQLSGDWPDQYAIK